MKVCTRCVALDTAQQVASSLNLYTIETEKLTVEKESEIKQIQDKISNKDMEIRRLHKQFRQNKDTCEGSV